MGPELASVSSDQAVVLRDDRLIIYDGLPAASTLTFDGLTVTTLPRPGEHLATLTTTNDVHFGESECGRVGDAPDQGPVFRVPSGAEPYPTMMSRLAIKEMAELDPAAVVVKGDLTDQGKPEEYAAFLDCYRSTFGSRLLHVRGNHDCYEGQRYAAWPFQEVQLAGAIVALLDTCRPRMVNGSLTDEQLAQLDELGSRADRPVIVLGHHPIWDARWQPRDDTVFGLLPEPTERLLEVFRRRPRLVTYAAGHTHRNHVVEIHGTPFVEVGSVKDFPGAWCEYQVYDGGILQIIRRVAHPDGLAWAEKTRGMFSGTYGAYALGTIEDRCRLIPTNR